MVRVHLNGRPIVAVTHGDIVSTWQNELYEQPRLQHARFEDDGPGLLSDLGPRHDNDHVHIHDIKILPSADECLCTNRAPWMPEKNIDSPHFIVHGYSRHVDTHFRLLRYDSTEKIRDMNVKAAQEAFLSDATVEELNMNYVETPTGNRFFLYHNVRVEGVIPQEHEGLTLRMSYDCPEQLRGRALHQSKRLEKGMLCAILCLYHDTNQLSAHYFNIEQRESTYALKRRGKGKRAAVQLTLLPDYDEQTTFNALSIATGVHQNVTMALIEYPTLLYAGFANTLRCLQKMSDQDYAFGQYICPPAECYDTHQQQLQIQPPSYSRRPDYTFDLSPLTNDPESCFSVCDSAGDSLKSSLDHLASNTTLDEGQAVALLSSLNREFAFTQGPPGTGKTFLGLALTRVLLASRPAESKRPILVVCHTNHALDSFMADLRDAGIEGLMRVGRSSKADWTEKINLREIVKDHKSTGREKHDQSRICEEVDDSFVHLEAWCKGLSKEVLTGFPC